jgi:hypothetical protein
MRESEYPFEEYSDHTPAELTFDVINSVFKCGQVSGLNVIVARPRGQAFM